MFCRSQCFVLILIDVNLMVSFSLIFFLSPSRTGPNLDESAFLGERLLGNRDSEQMPVYSAAEELLSWCQKVTDGYHGVKITNLTTSWRNGLAFCAIIHHFRPDLIDFDSLRPSDVVGNCSMAFETAFSLGVPKLLEAKDMVAHSVPDRLSVMTYLYQLKSFFVGQTALRPRSGRLSRYNELEEECEEDVQRETVLSRNLSQVKSKCLDLFDCFDELDNARYMHKLQIDSDSPSSGNSAHSTAPTTSQMTSAYQEKLKAQNWNDCLDNTRNNNSAPRPFSGDGRATKKSGEMADRHAVDSRTKLMTRNQLMNPFDSDSEEEIELISKNDSKRKCAKFICFFILLNISHLLSLANHWVLTPSSSSTDSEDNSARSKSNSFSKEPVRKPLQFATSYQNDPRPLPTSYSTSSFPTYRLSSNPTSSVHSGLFKIANEPVEVAPGLLDLSSVKAYRLQRAFSAPTSQHFLIDPRKVCFWYFYLFSH